MIITKRYKISDLLDSYDDITARLEGIECHTEKFGPKVCWKITDEIPMMAVSNKDIYAVAPSGMEPHGLVFEVSLSGKHTLYFAVSLNR